MNTQIETDKILSTVKVAKYLQLSYSTIILWISNGKIKPAFRTAGGHYRFYKNDLKELYNKIHSQPSKANESINSFFRVNGSELLMPQSKIERTKDLHSPNEYKKTTPITKREISISENAEGVVTIVLK